MSSGICKITKEQEVNVRVCLFVIIHKDNNEVFISKFSVLKLYTHTRTHNPLRNSQVFLRRVKNTVVL